jgi:hypothetical protein
VPVFALTLGAASGDEPAVRLDQLNLDLSRVRSELVNAQSNLTAQTKVLWAQQHDLEFQDPEAVRIREDIKNLEAQLLEKRRLLAVRLSLIPAMRDVEKARRSLFAELQNLKDQEQAILREISALQNVSQVNP